MWGSRLAGLLLVAASGLGLHAAITGSAALAEPRFDPHQRGCDRSGGRPQKCDGVSGATSTTRPSPPPTQPPPPPTQPPPPPTPPADPPGAFLPPGDTAGSSDTSPSSTAGEGDTSIALGPPPAPVEGLPGAAPPVIDAPLRGPGGGGGVPLSMVFVIAAAGVATAVLVAHGALGRRMGVSVPHEGDTLRFK